MKILYTLLFIIFLIAPKAYPATGCSTYDGFYPNSNGTISPITGNVQYKNTNYIVFRTWDNDPRCGIRNNRIVSNRTPCDVIGVRNYGVLVTYDPADNNCVSVPFDDYVIPGMLLIGGIAYLRIRGI